ncbi:MAG: Orn/DAP/Arg decarboxylase 2 [Fluviicola sp.]|jgi:arginine decarboxylase|uniref:arginine decarboxylase n=1 Tax=Fluviicola sp. TaxID=1917219 RepID=UPI00260CEA41|nr:arginine decarboxylase [Fluviicola sp.]MDF3027894.1 Orn/DAP/Arg decarboxylase 2 [Fluviicola sp.]
MRTKYIDLIDQTFDFPQDEFHLREDRLMFHGIDLMRLIEEYGTPLKFNYLPQISHNIQRAKGWFREAMNNLGYSGNYYYSYCTKSSHFSFVLDEVLKNDVHIETSSAFDIDIVKNVLNAGKLKEGSYVICNGFKPPKYIQNIADLIEDKRLNIIPVVDNTAEIHDLIAATGENELKIGIRIASEEEPKFEFYTSRLGIRYREIVPFYKAFIQDNPRVQIKMLHFFINTGINDTSYYWNELTKCLRIYSDLKKVCPTLDSLNIGGGFPIKKSLAFDFDYAYMVREILMQVKRVCSDNDIPEPNIYTEFGSFTVGESGGAIFNVLHQKQQNDREKWNMIDSSFMTNLPDTWAINQRFIMLAINRWNDDYERVLLGGLTCDSDDYYNSEQHSNAIYLPKFDKNKPLYIGFFNTGAYQETIGGYGGLKHCLIPEPKHVLIQRDEHGKIVSELFSEEQTADDFMRILGYRP